MNRTTKKTRPETAATVQSASDQVHLDFTSTGAERQAPDLMKFMQTSIWEYGTALDVVEGDLERVNDILVILSDILGSEECSAYAQQFDAVAIMAISFVNELREQVNKAAQGIYAHDKLRRALTGGDQP